MPSICLVYAYYMALGGFLPGERGCSFSQAESQRDSVSKPSVASSELPWEKGESATLYQDRRTANRPGSQRPRRLPGLSYRLPSKWL
jgi:hypothetical protein